MKWPLALVFFLFPVFAVFAQDSPVPEYYNTTLINIPAAETNSTAAIAAFINSHYTNDQQKLWAAYSWVAGNIRYDTDSMYFINSGHDSSERISGALRRRKGVCENFAAIFNDIASKCGLECYEVTGYTKQYGAVDKSAHTWCAVKLNGNWFLCDPTWDAGNSSSAKYFLVAPDQFIKSHMPFDPLWQLLDHPISHNEFYSGIINYGKRNATLNYKDSVEKYLRMGELEQLKSSASRINNAGIKNDLTRARLAYVNMQVSIIEQEKDLADYNAAVSGFNNANDLYNAFIRYRNDNFVPKKDDAEIRKMLLPIDAILAMAGKKIKELDSSESNFQYNTASLKSRIEDLQYKTRIQKEFLKKYFETAPSERENLFYE